MNKEIRTFTSIPIFTLLITGPLLAQEWRDQVGYPELLDYLRVTALPSETTDGIPLMMVEAPAGNDNYIPSINNNQFNGKSFTDLSNGNGTASNHANTVANRYYSTNSFIAGTNSVELYEANDFLNNHLRLVGTVADFPGKVASHAWVGNENNNAQTANFEEWLTRYDFAGSTGNTLMVAGLNNGAGTSVPTLWGQAYNGVTVGRTSGRHSRNGTLDTYEALGYTEGRTKPDIVSPDSFTSYSTGQVASGAGYLYGYADSLQHVTITGNTDLLKAILLAGASKEEFPNWANRATNENLEESLDPIFGAGELNVFNSHRIIEGGQPVNGTLPLHGWTHITNLQNSSVSYSFTIPATAGEVQFNAALCWHREVTEVSGLLSTIYTQQDLADLRMELSGGTLAQPLVCDSSIDNVEYLYNPTLGAGTYVLTVSNSTGTIPTNAGLAWRINLGDAAQVSTAAVSPTELTLTNLVPGVKYQIWESDDLSSFSFLEEFTATSQSETWTAPNATGERHFYRVKFYR